MQQNSMLTIAFEVCTKEILTEVHWSNSPRWKVHAQTGTRFEYKSTKLDPLLCNQHATIQQSFLISTTLDPTQSIWNSLISFRQTISILFMWQSVWTMVYTVQIQCREYRKLLMTGQCPLSVLAATIPGFIWMKYYHRVNNRDKYADGCFNSKIDDKDGHTPSLLIMFTCTALRHALLEWQKNQTVPLKASKSKLKAVRLECSNYLNHKNDSGNNASCCTATGRQLLTMPGIADAHIFLMNTWNIQPESYQQRVYKNTITTVKRQIQQAQNPTAAGVISTEAASVDNAILLDYWTSEVALQEPEIGSTDSNILIHNNCTDDKLHFWMPGGQRWLQRWMCGNRWELWHSDWLPATMGPTWTREVWPGNQWCQWVWGRQWTQCSWGWGGRSIASRQYINTELGGLRE